MSTAATEEGSGEDAIKEERFLIHTHIFVFVLFHERLSRNFLCILYRVYPSVLVLRLQYNFITKSREPAGRTDDQTTIW